MKKKLIALVIFFAMMFALAIPAMGLDVTAPKVTINLDGVRDDGYAGPFDIKYFNADGEQSGATGQFWVAWDDNCLYYFVDVADATPFHEHANSYERDCVEFFFDWYNGRDEDTGDEAHPYWQVRIMSSRATDNPSDLEPDGEEVNINENWAALGWDQPQDKLAAIIANKVVNLTATNYTIEVGIPYKQFGINLSEGSVVGSDLMIGDNQTGDSRASMSFPDPNFTSNNQYAAPNELGLQITLGAAPPPPAAPAEDVPAPAGDAPAPAPAPAPSPTTGNSGIIALTAVMMIAAAGIVIFRRKAVR